MSISTAHAHQPINRRHNDRRFLLVGNAPYRNRGCEAIVRGTTDILSATFGEDLDIGLGVMASPETVRSQCVAEVDPRVKAFSVSSVGPRGSLKWMLSQANHRLGTTFKSHIADLKGHMDGVAAALAVGGDNYSLDYGRPWRYVAIDRALKSHGIPVVLWGASVGPFDNDPVLAQRMFDHLNQLDGIFLREPITLAYLRENGVEHNVHQVADPAFLLKPIEPADEKIRMLVREGAIGINISPLVARFLEGESNLERWRDRASELVVAIADRTKRPILLIPHAGAANAADDDFAFMAGVFNKARQSLTTPIDSVPPGLSAGETKWLIGRCAVFAGARTHATIASLSSFVPTLSLSYSVKAVGINQDLFGHSEYCQSIRTLTPTLLAAHVARLLNEETAIRAHLRQEIPKAKERAMRAGPLLRDILNRRSR